MQRIGIAASHIAKGNLLLYNFFVVLISFLFSLLIFVISGMAIVFGLALVAYLTQTPSIIDLKHGVISPIPICLIFLGMVISIFNLYAIGINIKIRRN
ncbi:MAG: hypothetical protein NT079_00075 [Candidatus Omnitrophica bacterium]|nr:hypothetical protein [Candidatus Omnitrophota bacterium]